MVPRGHVELGGRVFRLHVRGGSGLHLQEWCRRHPDVYRRLLGLFGRIFLLREKVAAGADRFATGIPHQAVFALYDLFLLRCADSPGHRGHWAGSVHLVSFRFLRARLCGSEGGRAGIHAHGFSTLGRRGRRGDGVLHRDRRAVGGGAVGRGAVHHPRRDVADHLPAFVHVSRTRQRVFRGRGEAVAGCAAGLFHAAGRCGESVVPPLVLHQLAARLQRRLGAGAAVSQRGG